MKAADPQDDVVTIRAVRRALAILRAFRAADGELPLGQIAQRAQLDKGTTRRLLKTLMVERLVEQRDVGMTYSLGMGVLELAAGLRAGGDLRGQAQPILAELATATETTVFLVVMYDREAMCVGRVDGGNTIQIRAFSIGGRLKLHCGAGPRVLLAHLPDAEQQEFLSGRLEALTAATLTDPAELRVRLQTIRERGWDLAIDEVVEGVVSLAAPVADADGTVVGTISIAGPHPHMLENGQPRHLAALQSAVHALQTRLRSPPLLAQ